MSPHRRASLDLSRSEAWVVHTALLARIERETEAGNEVEQEVELLRAVEAGATEATLEPAQLELLADALSAYLADAPGRDRIPGQSVLDEISVVLA